MVRAMRKGGMCDMIWVTRDVAPSIVTVWSVSWCVASESHLRHSVVDLPYLLSGSVTMLVYPPCKYCIMITHSSNTAEVR